MVFPVGMHECETWIIKKAEHQGIDALESPLDCKEIQSILKEISPEYSLEGLMLKLKVQYFGHLMWRANSLEKTLMLGKIEAGAEGDNRGWDGCMVSLTMNMSLSKLREMVKDKEAWCAAVHGVAKSWTRLSDWTSTTQMPYSSSYYEFSFVVKS